MRAVVQGRGSSRTGLPRGAEGNVMRQELMSGQSSVLHCETLGFKTCYRL